MGSLDMYQVGVAGCVWVPEAVKNCGRGCGNCGLCGLGVMDANVDASSMMRKSIPFQVAGRGSP